MSNHKKVDDINMTTEESQACSFPRWQQHKATLNNMEYDEFVEAAQKETNSVLVDVRTIEEYNSGTIEGAIHMDYLSPVLADNIETLTSHSSYYVFCRTGRRSLRVCMLLKNMGLKVYNLESGIISRKTS